MALVSEVAAMKRLLAAVGTMFLLVTACASPTVPTSTPGTPMPSATITQTTAPSSSVTPSVTPTPVPPSVEVKCSDGDHALGTCSLLEQAALAAVAGLGFPIKTLDISPLGWPCGVPFPGSMFEPACPVALNGPTAYATFLGTDKVAALTFSRKTNEPVKATVIAFQVPPTGPAPA